MNALVKAEKNFLVLFLRSSNKQRKGLIEIIEKPQVRAIIQIVYNIIQGYRPLPVEEKRKLNKKSEFIRDFIGRGLSFKKRKELLKKNYKYILPFIKAIENDL